MSKSLKSELEESASSSSDSNVISTPSKYFVGEIPTTIDVMLLMSEMSKVFETTAQKHPKCRMLVMCCQDNVSLMQVVSRTPHINSYTRLFPTQEEHVPLTGRVYRCFVVETVDEHRQVFKYFSQFQDFSFQDETNHLASRLVMLREPPKVVSLN